MAAAVIILSIILITVVIYHITYRRQVRRLGRQLAFLNEHQSAMRPGVELTAKDLMLLADEADRLNEKCKAVKLECLNEDTVLRQTITNISHDIRTPLTSLDGYFQLLAEPGLSEERKKYYLGIIRERIMNLNSMLDELFTYAKLQDHNYEIELTKTDIMAVTADIIMSFYEDIAKTGAEPVINLSEEPLYINGNKDALCRIEQNIIKNALMHGRDLRISLKSVIGDNNKKYVCFECSNALQNENSKIDVSRVFERFYKADESRNSKGSGLGMAIAKELTERHGGTAAAYYDDEKKEFSVKIMIELLEP